MKTFYVLTLGCQMNKSDSERLASTMRSFGYQPTTDEKNADVKIVNACSVRQSAIDRVFGFGRKWFKQKTPQAQTLTILTGCVLPDDKKTLSEKFDALIDIGDFKKLEEVLIKRFGRQQSLNTPAVLQEKSASLAAEEYSDYLKIRPIYNSSFSAFVPIMTGCNEFCTYCAVPYTRGREWGRPVADILSEINDLAQKGFIEITLLGQTVNSYKPQDKENFSSDNPFKKDYFAALLWEINQIDGIKKIFFTAPHPDHVTDEGIEALGLPKMVRYLHLPFQAGDNNILKKMNRRYTAEQYLALIKKIKQRWPDLAIATDIIVGFPGEDQAAFEKTLALYKEIEFDISYNARYSPRPGTYAAKHLTDDVSHEEKRRRWRVLQELMESITYKKNQAYKNKVVEVLVDRCDDDKCQGNSQHMKRVEFLGNDKLIGKIVKVKIKQPLTWVLRGDLYENSQI